jgi:predicted HD phosphohydrolase
MPPEESEAFSTDPDLRDMLRLRSWDEMAKDSAWRGPGIESYREALAHYLEGQAPLAHN